MFTCVIKRGRFTSILICNITLIVKQFSSLYRNNFRPTAHVKLYVHILHSYCRPREENNARYEISQVLQAISPILDTTTRLHNLKLGSNISHRTLRDIIQVNHWRFPYELCHVSSKRTQQIKILFNTDFSCIINNKSKAQKVEDFSTNILTGTFR